jgi:hypothetical protein
VNLSLINRDSNPGSLLSGFLQGAKLDPVAERREQTNRLWMGHGSYGFVSFLAEISDGTMTVDDFDRYLGFVVRDESMDAAEVCQHVIEQLQREPSRLDRANPDVVVRLHLKATMALV